MADYTINENSPGYMPDGDPSGPMDWDDAVADLVSRMQSYADELVEGADPDQSYADDLDRRIHTLCWDGLSIDIDDPEDRAPELPQGVSIIFEGRCFFIADDEEPG